MLLQTSPLVCHAGAVLIHICVNLNVCCRSGCKLYCGLCPGFPPGTLSTNSSSPSLLGAPDQLVPAVTSPGISPTSTSAVVCVDVAPPGSPYTCAIQVTSSTSCSSPNHHSILLAGKISCYSVVAFVDCLLTVWVHTPSFAGQHSKHRP